MTTPSGQAYARFADSCSSCPLRDRCTASPSGRTISIGPYEALLAKARQRQKDQAWIDDYRATRPKVERKLAHLLRRRHGGRRARGRGRPRVDQDWKLLAAAINLARFAALGVELDNRTLVDARPASLGLRYLQVLMRRAWSRSQAFVGRISRSTGSNGIMAVRIPYSAPAT